MMLIFPEAASSGSLYLSAYAAVQSILLLLIPLSFGFAMLRSGCGTLMCSSTARWSMER